MWKPFWFEGNQWHGMVNTEDDWRKLKYTYMKEAGYTTDTLLTTQRFNKAEIPYFGFTKECRGKETLRKFFDKNEMQP